MVPVAVPLITDAASRDSGAESLGIIYSFMSLVKHTVQSAVHCLSRLFWQKDNEPPFRND